MTWGHIGYHITQDAESEHCHIRGGGGESGLYCPCEQREGICQEGGNLPRGRRSVKR